MKIFFQYISALLLVFSLCSFAQEKADNSDEATAISFSSTAPITVKADRMQMKNKDGQRNAQYSGNVLVTQQGLKIKADNLNVLSKEEKNKIFKSHR